MDILMVTAELSPYARGSRAGDAVAALSKALCQLEHRVTLAVPRYPGFEAGGVLAARRLTPLRLESGEEVTVLDSQLPTGARLVLLDAPALFDRPGIFGRASEDAERFGFLCDAALALVRQRGEREPFDVVHLHDWPAAALAGRLSALTPPVPSVLTIHDVSRRGVVSGDIAARLGVLGTEETHREGQGVSVLAAGAVAAGAVTSVSTTVARDLLDEGRFGALSRALGGRGDAVTGIPSGIDYAIYNPATDAALRSRYDGEDASNKGIAKTELLRARGLELGIERPLCVAIVEEGPESGADILERAVEPILKNDIALFVLVRGEVPLERLERLRAEFGGRLAVERSSEEPTVRKACAAADLVLLPARYEPTATLVRVAQRYGALPVAQAAGASIDAIVDADAALDTGTGFLYEEATATALAGAVARGIAAFTSQRWPGLRRRVMRLDLAWDRPARRYAQVYRQAKAASDR
jgi:starch synthase